MDAPVPGAVASAIAYEQIGSAGTSAGWTVVWAHGWGQDRRAAGPIAQSLAGLGSQVLIDLPGFGQSPPAPETWGTEEYADAAADLLRSFARRGRTAWVGHSFGGRVGIQLAARHPGLLDRLVLLASAGLPRRRPLAKQLVVSGKIHAFKALKALAPAFGWDVDKLRAAFGSADYRAAGFKRHLMVKAANEDLAPVAKRVGCPTLLIYGANDTETPPEIGHRLARIVAGARMVVLEGQDHYSLLGEGRHLVARRIKAFLGEAA